MVLNLEPQILGVDRKEFDLGKFADEHRDPNNESSGVEVDVVLTVGGIELDVEHLVYRWQEQVNSSIETAAKELVDDQFAEVIDLVYVLQTRLKSEIDKRLEDWEKM